MQRQSQQRLGVRAWWRVGVAVLLGPVAGAAEPALSGAFVPLDLSYALNRDHTASPYYEGQAASYAWLRPGVLTASTPAGAIPFTIVDPATTGGRSVFISSGQRNTFPRRAVFLAYRQPAR